MGDVKYGMDDFTYPKDFGFSRSSERDVAPKNSTPMNDHEFGDGTYVGKKCRGGKVSHYAHGGEHSVGEDGAKKRHMVDGHLREDGHYAIGGAAQGSMNPLMGGNGASVQPPDPMSLATISMPASAAKAAMQKAVQAGMGIGAQSAMRGVANAQQQLRQPVAGRPTAMPSPNPGGAVSSQSNFGSGTPGSAPGPGTLPQMTAMAHGGHHLTAAERHALPAKNFALPGERYPIEDKAHARNAEARVAQHGSPSEIARVRAAVHRKYPDIGKE